MYKYLFFLLIPLLIGCNRTNKSHTYIGGKIINPKAKSVNLSNAFGVIKTIPLKQDHTFLTNIDTLKRGLYYFNHGDEGLHIFIESNDSLFLELDTWEFDESIIFRGKGANRNNQLASVYLQNQERNTYLSQFYDSSYDVFKEKLDSIERLRFKILNDFKKKTKESKQFIDVLEESLICEIHNHIEKYSIFNLEKGNKIDLIKILKHRKTLDLKKDTMIYSYYYKDLVMNTFYNNSLLKGYKKYTEDYSNSIIRDIGDNILNLKERDNLSYTSMWSYLYSKPSYCGVDKILKMYLSISTNEGQKKVITSVAADMQLAKKNASLDSFVVSVEGNDVNILDFIKNKKVVLCFNNKSIEEFTVSKTVNQMITKFPEIEFYTILNKGEGLIKELDPKHQIYLKNNDDVNFFSKTVQPRIVLVNKKGIIQNEYTRFLTTNLPELLDSLQKQ